MENSAEVMQKISAGDETAMALLDEHFRPKLLGFLRRHVSEEVAEDLVQITLLKVWRGASSYMPGGNLLTWMYSIAHRSMVDHFRAERRRVAICHASVDLDCTFGSAPEPPEKNLDRSAVRTVAGRIASERFDFGQSVIDDFFEGRTHAEISSKHGISESASRWRMTAVMQTLANSREFVENFRD